MRARAIALLFACAAPVVAGGDRPMNPSFSSQRPFAAPTFYLQYLQVGRKYVFETRNLTKHADSALVMLEDERPVAYNEDRARTSSDRLRPRESRLEFVPKRYASYAIQLRAQEGEFGGTCDLFMDGKLLGKDLVFGELQRRPKKPTMPMPGKIVKPGVEPEVDQYEIYPKPRRE